MTQFTAVQYARLDKARAYKAELRKRKGQKYSYGVVHSAKEFSKTFKGIAKAMADQWGRFYEVYSRGNEDVPTDYIGSAEKEKR